VTTLRWIVYGLAACSLFAGIFVFSRTSQDPDLAPSAFQRRSLISLALCEAGAIGGLVLLVIGRSLVDFLAPGMAVLGVIMSYFPHIRGSISLIFCPAPGWAGLGG
jgi:hypothetical protein